MSKSIFPLSCLFLCFNESCHVYLPVRTCFKIYLMSIDVILLFEYFVDISLQFGDKLGFR
jgi:hypothetical protein